MHIIRWSEKPGLWAIIKSDSLALPAGCDYFRIPLEELSFSFEFNRDGTGGQSVELIGSSDKDSRIALVNFDNPLGTSLSVPAGKYQGKDFVISLIVHTLSTDQSSIPARSVTYSIIQRIE